MTEDTWLMSWYRFINVTLRLITNLFKSDMVFYGMGKITNFIYTSIYLWLQ